MPNQAEPSESAHSSKPSAKLEGDARGLEVRAESRDLAPGPDWNPLLEIPSLEVLGGPRVALAAGGGTAFLLAMLPSFLSFLGSSPIWISSLGLGFAHSAMVVGVFVRLSQLSLGEGGAAGFRKTLFELGPPLLGWCFLVGVIQFFVSQLAARTFGFQAFFYLPLTFSPWMIWVQYRGMAEMAAKRPRRIRLPRLFGKVLWDTLALPWVLLTALPWALRWLSGRSKAPQPLDPARAFVSLYALQTVYHLGLSLLFGVMAFGGSTSGFFAAVRTVGIFLPWFVLGIPMAKTLVADVQRELGPGVSPEPFRKIT